MELREEGYFKAVDKSFDSFNASLGYKTNWWFDFKVEPGLI
jgi:iron complex outermembrane receptor protein